MLNRLSRIQFDTDSPAFHLLERTYKALLVIATGSLLLFVLTWPFPRNTQYQQLAVGDIIPNDVVAPVSKNFESAILTAQERERAMAAVAPVYDPPSNRARLQQVETARQVLEFITIVRTDPFADEEERTDYLSSIYELPLSQEEILTILTLSDEEWTQITEVVPVVLGRAMREEIHDNEGALRNARRGLPSLIVEEMSEPSLEMTVALVGDLLVANSFRNEDSTTELQQQAAASVEPIRRSFEQGENVIRRNTKVTGEDLEALEALGLLQSEWSWWILARAIAFTIVLIAAVLFAIFRLYPEVLNSFPKLSLLALLTVLWLIIAKFMIIPHQWLPYLFPLATLGMLVAVLIDLRIAVIMTLAFTIVVLFLSNANDVVVIFLSMSSLFGALILGRAERLTAFLWTGLAVVISNLLIYAAFRLPFQDFTNSSQLQEILLLTINGFLSASIALLGYFILGNIFGLTTSLQLTELSRPTHPLLRQLLLKSPGTYHHTIVVSNMAERAAAAIDADAMLTRVGAYYHDIGKTVRPYFFIENSAEGAESPHAKLDPLTSAQIILSHVTDGIDLAQKYKLPGRIQDFIREHHGRAVIKSFYIPALEQAKKDGEEINQEDFRYAGPSPRTKETAILMLADTCESAVRAIRPNTRQELAKLINRLIDNRVEEGDLDDCNLTFQELQIVKEIFGQVLQGVHHPRVNYPTSVEESAQNDAMTPPPASETAKANPAVEPTANIPGGNGILTAPSLPESVSRLTSTAASTVTKVDANATDTNTSDANVSDANAADASATDASATDADAVPTQVDDAGTPKNSERAVNIPTAKAPSPSGNLDERHESVLVEASADPPNLELTPHPIHRRKSVPTVPGGVEQPA